ncbi:MAG: IS110 family transposase [Gammaproteobacteria bacterium]|nr:IS110 family transposase [Gammaproteobacteria bacterium]
MNNIMIVGIDLAKSVFQVCGLNQARKVMFNRGVSRAKLLTLLRTYPGALIAMEACGSAHHWARTLASMGYEVRLIPAQHVKAFCRGNKSDVHDALAIAESVFRPDIHEVAVKSLEQQDIQTLLRIRTRHKDSRKNTVNQIRGLLSEYGLVMPKTIVQFDRHLPVILEDGDNGLTPIARIAISELYEQHQEVSRKIVKADQQLKQLAQGHEIAKQLMCIRGIGPITSLALFASVGTAQQFRNARQFAAWLGLVPKQHGTGGQMKLGSISKRGNCYLRLLLIHGARTVMNWMKDKRDVFSVWAKALVERRGKHKAIVAVANKTARMVWVVLQKGVEALPQPHLSAAM